MANLHCGAPFAKDPSDKLTDEHLLSYLLEYCEEQPSEKAQQILTRFGNLANLLDAVPADLKLDSFLSNRSITLLHLVSEFHRRYLFIRSRTEVRMLDHASIADYLAPLFAGVQEEAAFLLTLDDSKSVLSCTQLAIGTAEATFLPLRMLVKEALVKKASYVVIAHNHPSGARTPSKEDIQSTFALRDLLQPLDIRLLDHLIFTESGYCSLVECGYYRP